MKKSKETSLYLKQVSKKCPVSFRKRMMMDIESSLSDYSDEHPNCTIDDIVQHFGTPEKFADEYILALDEKSREKLLSKAKWLKWGFLIGIVIFLIIVAIAAIWIIFENSQIAGYYYEHITN